MMPLALAIGYSGARMELPVRQVQRAEALGYHSVWTAEAYGSDAFSPLAYLAAVTRRIRLGTGIIQLAARSAANAAMTAGTIDALAGGDRLLHPGVGSPQLFEARIAPDEEISLHAHAEDEIIYILEGELQIGRKRLGPGASVFVAGNTLYGFRSGAAGVRFLNFRARGNTSFITEEEFRAARRRE